MRKVLLATTALVAMSVTSAQADLSISGQGVFEILEPDSGKQEFSTDGAIKFKGTSTSDSGLTFTAFVEQKFEGVGVPKDASPDSMKSTGKFTQNNDSWLEISGEFGSLRMGSTDDVLDLNDGVLAANMDLETTGTPDYDINDTDSPAITGTAIGGDNTQIGYTSPTISGAKVYASVDADGGNTEYGVNYTMSGITLMAQQNDGASVVGASFSAGGFKIGMGRSQKDATSSRKKISASDIGVSYTMGDITVVATSARGTEANTANRKDTYQNVGVSYAIAPGVTAMIETASYDRSDDNQYDGQSTWVALAIDF
jgi:hypothetical protein